MKTSNKLFVICTIYVPIMLIALLYPQIHDFYTYAIPLDGLSVYQDEFYNFENEFQKIIKDNVSCFTTPSMNYFCYSKPRMYEEGHGVSYLYGNTTKISGELHVDKIDVGPSYFTIKNMTLIKGETAKITLADKDFRIGNATFTQYEITDNFEFTKIIKKFDTFIAYCDNYEGTSVTVVQYLGITKIDGVNYFMTWHTQMNSKSGIKCDYPQIIKYSFGHDFGI